MSKEEDVKIVYKLIGAIKALKMTGSFIDSARYNLYRQAKESKAYMLLDMDWREFCQKELGHDIEKVNMEIKMLEEYGEPFLRAAEQIRLTKRELNAFGRSLTEDAKAEVKRGIIKIGDVEFKIEELADNVEEFKANIDLLCKHKELETKEKKHLEKKLEGLEKEHKREVQACAKEIADLKALYPPDWVDVDDLENDLNVRNPRLIKETIDWLLTAVLCSLADNYTFMMIGTILTRKSVLSQMMMMKSESNPDKTRFMSKIYKAITEFGVPLWPEEWPMERLMKLKAQIGSVRFNQEMMNDPKDDEGLFHEEWIRYYHPEELLGKALWVYTFIDPSMESRASSDYKAIITIGMDLDGIYYVLDAFIRKCSIDTMARVSYTRYEELHPLVISMEENALGEFAQSPFLMVAKDKKYQLPIKGIKHTIAKEARIGRLSAHVERGMIRFRKGHSDQDLLVEQLIYYPSTTVNDDGPDALEGAVDMAERWVYQKMEYTQIAPRRMAMAGAY